MTIQIYDNFLPPAEFEAIRHRVCGDSDFPWFYNRSVLHGYAKEDPNDHPYNFQFCHSVFKNHQPQSPAWDLIQPLVTRINAEAWVRIKFNLNTRTDEQVTHGMHIDIDEFFAGKTGVFYLNTNNGKTVFEDGRECASVANRLVLFDPRLKHSGTSCTDQKARILLNLNFFPSESILLTKQDVARIKQSSI